jgi:hypothetical protein
MSTKSNELTRNYSGIFGNQVLLKNQGSRSVMTIPPYRPPKNPSPAQEAVRKRFAEAANYAKNVLADTAMQEAYDQAGEKKGVTAYVAAMTDFLVPPRISGIDTRAYHGVAGDQIAVSAGDDFRLTGVKVTIADPAGTLIEQGDCTLNPLTSQYDYTATVAVNELPGVTITAIATDTPGHTAELTVVL